MAATGITDAMIQYEKASEAIYKKRPKHAKAHGFRMPDTRNMIAVFAALFVIVMVISQLM